MIQLFVTGTDTDVGKTTVACAITAAARARGVRVQTWKPVESGCAAGPTGELLPADALALAAAERGHTPRAVPFHTVYRFAAPVAPSVAAAEVGQRVALAPLLRTAARLRSLAPDMLLIEGAGGLLVPLAPQLTIADLACALTAPLLLVARERLGTINHTLLTIEAAARRGLAIRGVVLNATGETSAADAEVQQNAAEIERCSGVPVLGHFPPAKDLGPTTLAAAAERHLDLDQLLAPTHRDRR